RVIGQPNFTAHAQSGGHTPLDFAQGVALVSGGVFVAGVSTGVSFIGPGATNDPSPVFSVLTNAGIVVRPDATYATNSVALLPGSRLAIGDASGNRVGLFRNVPTAPSSYAATLGQVDASRMSTSPTSLSSISSTARVSSSGGKTFVLDKFRALV